jgi:error-prone DNA polymerase
VVCRQAVREIQRAELLRSRLLAVYGRWQREADVMNLIVRKLVDLTPSLGGLATASRDLK